SSMISYFYGNEVLSRQISFISVSFIINALSNQFKMLMEKEFKFNVLAKIEMLSNVISFFVTIFLAYNDYKVLSLVYGYLVQVSISTVLVLLLNGHRFTRFKSFSLSSVREYLSFGSYQIGERCLNYITSQLDSIIIGKVMGIHALGIYSIAKNLVARPLQLLLPIASRILLPYLSKLKDTPNKLEDEYINSINIISTVCFFIFSYLALFSEEMFNLFFIEDWRDSSIIFTILCIQALFTSHASPVSLLFLTKSRADIGFKWNLAMFFIIPLYLYVMSSFSLIVLACSFILLKVLQFYPAWYCLIRPVSSISFGNYFLSFFRPLLSSMLSVFFTYSCLIGIEEQSIRMILGFLLLILGYLLSLFIFNRKIFGQFFNYIFPFSSNFRV
ncbi:oligosaccharide flippase family protein, partial [Shewanella indica]|uniref:oligosaccharide flippase family protein n=1 Tax=Shewanella indica TaxID=768528 RepID=UPI001F347CED